MWREVRLKGNSFTYPHYHFFFFWNMSWRLTAREVCNLFVMELKVEDDDNDQEKCIDVEEYNFGRSWRWINWWNWSKKPHMTGADGVDKDDDGNNQQPSWTSFIREKSCRNKPAGVVSLDLLVEQHNTQMYIFLQVFFLCCLLLLY